MRRKQVVGLRPLLSGALAPLLQRPHSLGTTKLEHRLPGNGLPAVAASALPTVIVGGRCSCLRADSIVRYIGAWG